MRRRTVLKLFLALSVVAAGLGFAGTPDPAELERLRDESADRAVANVFAGGELEDPDAEAAEQLRSLERQWKFWSAVMGIGVLGTLVLGVTLVATRKRTAWG